MKHALFGVAAVALVFAMLPGCAFLRPDYPNSRYRGDKYIDAREPSKLATTGVESSDVKSACSHVVGKLLADPLLASAANPPTYSIEAAQFTALGIDDFDTTALADLVRDELINAAEGRVRVVKNCDGGTPGVQYTVGARVTEVSQESRGLEEAYVQIAFNVVDANTKQIVLSDLHSFKKAAMAGSSNWH